jgi:SPP1 gp7 family putative phage head morphogenesis protein
VNEAQSLRTVRNVLRLENLSADIAAPVQRELTRILQEVAAMVEAMDDDPLNATLFRQARWRTYQAQLRLMLQPVNDEFYDLLVRELAAEIPRQVQNAERLMLDAGITPYQTAAEVLPPGVGTDGSVGVPAITRTQLYRAAADTKVLNRPLQRLFESATARPPAPPPVSQERGSVFIESQIRQIDAVVKRGFLLGETNQEIAKNLLTDGAARSRREAATISRTAVMQMSADAHNEFWDANSSVIAGWEYDALMDTYRTCPVCRPWDGRTAMERKDLPAVPQHPNCRCSVVPLTETELELRKERGPQRRTVVELVPYDGPDSKPSETDTQRVYAKTASVDGKRYWRVARDIKQADHPLTHGEFLAQTTDTNLEKALLTQKRAKAFRELVKGGTSPDAALVRVTQPFHQPAQMAPSLKKKQRGIPSIKEAGAPTEAPKVREIPRVPRPAGVSRAAARREWERLRRR